MKHFLHLIFAAACSVVLMAGAAAPSEAARRGASPGGSGAYDGLWSVSIVTLAGLCARSYRYPVRIVRGRVAQADADASYRLYGAVAASGAIRVIVARAGQWADGRGRLAGNRGHGRWRTSGGQCSGDWTAVRRG